LSSPSIVREMTPTPRSLLFVPGGDPALMAKADASEADAIVIDLEDSVAAADKAAARRHVVRFVERRHAARMCLARINSPLSPAGREDLDALQGAPIDAIVVPKAEPRALARLDPDGVPVVALIETAAGLRRGGDIAGHPRVLRLQLGAEDLAAQLRLHDRDDGLHLLVPRVELVLASAEARLSAPVDVVVTRYDDRERLERESRLARSLGFGGKACIHPAQVPIVNRVFTASEQELAHARDVVAHWEQRGGSGAATSLHGEMIDPAVVKRARAALAQAGRGR
jgi:citrate lyase beta subunit